MDHIRMIELKPDFQNGLKLLKEKNLNKAVDVLGELYGQIVEEEGDLGKAVAPIAYLYGDANLRLAVESNSEFLNAEMKKRAEKTQKDENGNAVEEGEEEQEEDAEPIQPITKEDVVELFEIAWECLDTCRVIYERLALEEQDSGKVKEVRERLAEAMLRLGDLKFEQGQFEESIPEFEKCLGLRMEIETDDSRELGTAYHSLGMAHEFAASENPDVNHRIQSAVNFAKAQATLRSNRNKLLSFSENREGARAEDSSNSKKKAFRRSRNWVSALTADQLDAVDEAFATSAVPLTPEKQESYSAESNELADLIQELAAKVDDVTWDLTEEGVAEEKSRQEEEAQRKLNGAAGDGDGVVESIGFSPTPSSSSATTAATALLPQVPTTLNEVQPNMLQPKKKVKATPQQSSDTVAPQ